MEQNRLWHEPVVEIYGNAISPGVSRSAKAYDLANRRWYELNISGTAGSPKGNSSHDEDNRRSPTNPFQVPDDDWLSSTVRKHVNNYHKSTGSPPGWNIINTTCAGHPVTFEQGRGGRHVGFPISECFFYGHKSSDLLPTMGFRALKNKTYLSRGADYCDWEGRKCVFKRIEFDCDNESHEQEIRVREHLIQSMAEKSSPGPLDFSNEMMRRYNVVPILGVVLHDDTSQWMVQRRTELSVEEAGDACNKECDSEAEGEEALPVASMREVGEAVQKSHTVAGFITPYMGRSLELFGAAHPTTCMGSIEAHFPSMHALGSPNTTVDVPITVEQLLDLVRGVRELARCGITHGDICYWNIVLEEPRHGLAPSAGPMLLLIDMGDTAPDYENDAVALAGVLQWCLKHSPSLREDNYIRKKVIIASLLLNEIDFDRAIAVLSPMFASEHGDKIAASQHSDIQQAKRRRL